MIIKTIPVSPLMTNCYIVACQKTNEAVIIDAGDEPAKILSVVDELGVTVKMLINTHAHVDHTSAVNDIKKNRNVPFLIHQDEIPVLRELARSQQMYGFGDGKVPEVDEYLDESKVIQVGEQSLQVIETPGHSPGGVCFMVQQHLFAGDTLFSGSVGRTDLPGGSTSTLIESIHTKLMVLDDQVQVYPGHGPMTTIGAERRHNPFINR